MSLESVPQLRLSRAGVLSVLSPDMSVSGLDQFGMVPHISVPLNLKSTKKKQLYPSGFISSHRDVKIMSRSQAKTKKEWRQTKLVRTRCGRSTLRTPSQRGGGGWTIAGTKHSTRFFFNGRYYQFFVFQYV